MTQEHPQFRELFNLSADLFDSHHSFADIEKELLKRTNDPELSHAVVKEVKAFKYANRRQRGLKKMGAGALLLVVGFLITCINFHSNTPFTVIMYSFTIVGLLIMMWGAYDIIG